ncbi:15-hydroxyprostaglandin dehydrogenase [NAD(+)]-like isoform X3 [Conger conger]|uniref:15-hydroxyprostaglandin dehydrogenase [NAD(+)]-like isoform X3 n=1 Tax=Conger conger TaxID=82655 RepID=UPI002A5AC33B|nr:15-hydroxyprostaglandin dehydrogenase [NAD(+)]-like isoform X3 [Conger conger]
MALIGKVALVTGAGQGLGKGFSDILLKNGAKVALLDINENIGENTRADFGKGYGEDRVCFFTCDVASVEQLEDAFQKTIERFGRINIMSNNAGILNETNWEKMVAVNLNAVIRGTYLALQHMKKDTGGEGGVIVNTASLAGLGFLLTVPVYTATKHGVVGFTRAVAGASEESGYGVRINALCPGLVKTALLDSTSERHGQFAHLSHLSKEVVKKCGILEVPVVAEGFLQLVMDEGKNGAVMKITHEGAVYVDSDAFQKTIERFGRIHIMSNNAGIMDETNWEKMVAINLNAVIQGTYLALQHMKKDTGGEGGVIVNIASMAGLSPSTLLPVYGAAKHAVVGFSRSVADASMMSGYGVRINTLCPTAVKTPLLEGMSDVKKRGWFLHLSYLSEDIRAKLGIIEVPAVAEGFLQLVIDEDKNGAVMVVKEEGCSYVDFPKEFMLDLKAHIPCTEPKPPSQ